MARKGGPEYMFKNIIVAHDGTHCSDLALDYAIALVKRFGAQLTVCHVSDYAAATPLVAVPAVNDPSPLCEALYAESQIIAKHVQERAAAGGVAVALCDVDERPARGILDTATRIGADLIVVGSHSYRGLQRLLAPSVSQHVARDVHVPLLIVPHDSPACA